MKPIFITSIFGAIISYAFSNHFNLHTPQEGDKHTIVGGYNASIEDFPHQIGIYHEQDGSIIFLCGGSIIGEKYILTAAHCLTQEKDTYVVQAGSEIKYKGTIIPIAEVIPHPDYPRTQKDVGVIITKDPIKFSNVMKPFKLPPKGLHLKDESIVTVSGWGLTWSSDHSPTLKAVDIPVFNFEKCNIKWNHTLSEHVWCGAGTEEGGKGTCSGDSGGGAVQDAMVVGIVSGGEPCAQPNQPDVFTNVAAPAIRDFIKKHTGL